jgi:Flp pilus assembly protein TadB
VADAPDPEIDPRRVRAGLIILAVVVAVAVILVLAVDQPLLRAVMIAVIVFTFVRMFLITRAVRRDARRQS